MTPPERFPPEEEAVLVKAKQFQKYRKTLRGISAKRSQLCGKRTAIWFVAVLKDRILFTEWKEVFELRKESVN